MHNGVVVNYYAGIGSRETPDDVLQKMTGIAHTLNGMRYVLRSGGARGADAAFFNGCGGNVQLFRADNATHEALLLAPKFHPAWERCKKFDKNLHARNMMILLGRNLDTPVDFVVCWTPGGKTVGGTGQAMRAAQFFGIPIVNLYKEDLTYDKIMEYREEMNKIRFKYRGTVVNRSNSR